MITTRLRPLLAVVAFASTALTACGDPTEVRTESIAPGPKGMAYVANEATGTISVIDTNTDAIVATIGLGSDAAVAGTPQPNGPFNAESQHHNPFYNGQADPHGLWLTSNGRVLLVAARLSSTVVAVDAATNSVLGYQPVGREPHLATVRPGDAEAWVAVRGETYLDVLKLDPDDLFNPARRRTDRMESMTKIDTMLGPSMVSFSSDGRFAFVVAGKQGRVDKIDATSRQIVASGPVPAPFSPFGIVSPDDAELYVVHKSLGVVSVLRTSDLAPLASIPVGPRANHVAFVGRFAYVTVGGPAPTPDNPDPAGKVVVIDRLTREVAREMTGQEWAGEPHGIWRTGNGKLYVGHERGNRVSVVSIGKPDDAFDDVLKGVVTGSAADLAFLKKPIDVVVTP